MFSIHVTQMSTNHRTPFPSSFLAINRLQQTSLRLSLPISLSLPPLRSCVELSSAMATATQPKPKKPAASKKPKSPPSHPPFVEMITDAIVSLKERTGSSQYAITKFIEEKYKQLPSSFRKLLLHHLKKSAGAGKLVKVKNSFKLPPTRSAKVDAAPKKPKPAKAVSKPSANAASKPKPKTAANKTGAVSAKPKLAAKPKAKNSPSKKVASKPARKASVKSVKKPKSVKSPVKKTTAKKAKK